MKNKFNIIAFISSLMWWLIILYFITCYITNIIQLISVLNDENESTRHIIIHCVGLVPVASGFTVWF